jgi:hypothetical protein
VILPINSASIIIEPTNDWFIISQFINVNIVMLDTNLVTKILHFQPLYIVISLSNELCRSEEFMIQILVALIISL